MPKLSAGTPTGISTSLCSDTVMCPGTSMCTGTGICNGTEIYNGTVRFTDDFFLELTDHLIMRCCNKNKNAKASEIYL